MVALLAAVAVLAALAACREQELPPPVRSANTEYGFSIVLPPGWKTFEEKTRDCLASLGATGPDNGLVYVCVRQRPPDFATSQSEFVNCEQIKTYVEETLLGRRVECRTTTVQGRQAYEALYLRDVADAKGAVRKQFVNQTFLLRGDRLYAVTSYAMGTTEAKAHAAFNAHSEVVLRSVLTFFLHNGQGSGPPPQSGRERAQSP
ncbi:hypothetical protein G3N56_16190 [Desulfovibrio sulfodismutans]|uniref:DUF1795 domain-containing protein n=1 Tax=Desulfolutivibrio sulfodismutans TaxID=63561 RepID=A0A7K3NQ08_9BACT|nr:hypothetical protein [Desulfolutivibrio sulfodismutans]NDY58274.1 hypothetical protein [Desulfolutivibrio sulfodismutans]